MNKIMKRLVGFGGMMLSSSKELFNRKESEWLWRLLQALSVNEKEKEKKKRFSTEITRTQREAWERGHGPPQPPIYL
jgi:hypothetical protein